MGFLEGFTNDIYWAGALDLFSWANGVMLAGSLLGVVIYLIWSPEGLHREGFSSPGNINLPPISV
ncbi:MAG: hypothetical protein MUP21_10255 [Dehalococcoidia bacterium]|nr:hypothetical protein [Dehalococcoidia bacterium]